MPLVPARFLSFSFPLFSFFLVLVLVIFLSSPLLYFHFLLHFLFLSAFPSFPLPADSRTEPQIRDPPNLNAPHRRPKQSPPRRPQESPNLLVFCHHAMI